MGYIIVVSFLCISIIRLIIFYFNLFNNYCSHCCCCVFFVLLCFLFTRDVCLRPFIIIFSTAASSSLSTLISLRCTEFTPSLGNYNLNSITRSFAFLLFIWLPLHNQIFVSSRNKMSQGLWNCGWYIQARMTPKEITFKNG